MEKKIKYRLLGALVVVGLVVIVLPFLQSGKDLPTETTLVKAPPFPDQSIQVNPTPVAQNEQLTQNEESATNLTDENEASAETANTNNATPVTNPEIKAEEPTLAEANPANLPDEAIPASSPVNSIKVKKEQLVKEDDQAQEVVHTVKEVKSVVKKVHTVSHEPKIKVLSIKSVNHKLVTNKPLDANGLFKLKSAAWVLQVGSFKNKANALRLVNQLRANGYPAFIQQVSSSFGVSTRVFVGPELNQKDIRTVANQLENNMHVHGVIISYKPFAL